MSEESKHHKVYYIYSIVELTPAEGGDHERMVAQFDTMDAATHVLEALESVNINFNTYRIKTEEVRRRLNEV